MSISARALGLGLGLGLGFGLLAACGPREAPGPGEVSEARGTRGRVILVPLQAFPEELIVAVEEDLHAQLAVEVQRHDVLPLPSSAYYAPRKRYRAELLLDFLETLAEADGDPKVKVLGLTAVDISTTSDPHRDWGIFGLGRSGGSVAVISSFRLKRGATGRDHLRDRVAKTAVHELGHTFGLSHCSEHEARCVMLDAEGGIANTDTSSGSLGPGCQAKLELLAPR